MIGKTLSHFKITAKVGKGGMGEVFEAQDTKLGRKVALKILPSDLASDPEKVRRFEHEARTIAALDHPGIVTIFSVEKDQGVHFLTMQLVRGKSLDGVIEKGGVSISEFFDIAIPLADALRMNHCLSFRA